VISPENRKDLEDCFRSKSAAVFRFLYQFTKHDEQHARDLVQETFEKAAKNWGELSCLPDKNREAWLIDVARNTAISSFRKQRTVRENWPAVQARFLPDEADVHALAMNRIAMGRFNEVIRTMSPTRQQVAFLSLRCGWKQCDIAEALGISAGRVSSQLRLAIEALRKELRPYLPDSDGREEDSDHA
jgi:RNA polymerase sigma factor (sigma-70 family)